MPRKSTTQRRDIYQEVTDRIIAQLEEGIVPWAQPWDSTKASALPYSVDLPRNPTTGAAYSGINVLLLWDAAQRNSYPTQRWMTYRQASAIGAQVRRREASTQIVKVGSFTPAEERKRAHDEGREASSMPFLKFHSVFNAAQIDGLPEEDDLPAPPSLDEVDIRVRTILDKLGCRIILGTPTACYMPGPDVIQLPAPDAFYEPVDFHRTALHETAHATSAAHRLNRDTTGARGSAAYAAEELVAEMTAAFVCASYGIVPTVRHADYIGSWLKVLRNNKRCIVTAASAASKAADFLKALAIDADTIETG